MTERPIHAGREQMVPARPSLVVRLAKLRPVDVITIIRAVAWAVMTRLMMSARGWSSTARSLGFRPTQAEVEPGAFPALPARASRSVAVTRKVVKALGFKCLPLSVAVVRALAAAGVQADLVIGVLTAEGFKAHAWVEIEGYAVAEGGRNEWAALARFRRRT